MPKTVKVGIPIKFVFYDKSLYTMIGGGKIAFTYISYQYKLKMYIKIII